MNSHKPIFHPTTSLDLFLALLCFAAGLALYVFTLAPGLLRDDSAEFQTLASTLGMTHPTGYPVYILLAKGFTLLAPLRDIAYRVNLLSAVFGGLCLALVYLAGRILLGWRLPGFFGALALGLDPVFWSQAIIAELYTAAAACLAAELALIFTWRLSDRSGYLFAAGLLGGLSLGIHNTVALAAPAILIYLFMTARSWRNWLAASLGAGLGVALALGAFLFLDALNVPSSYFNSVARPSLSVWGLTSLEFASPYQRLSFLYTADQFRRFMLDFAIFQKLAGMYFGGMQWTTYALAGLGLLRLIWKNWKEALLVVIAYATMLVFVLTYSIPDIYVFFIPTLIPLVVLVISGLAGLMDAVRWLLSKAHSGSWSRWTTNLAALVLAIYLLSPALPDVQDSLQEGYPVFLSAYGLDQMVFPARTPDAPHMQAKAIVDGIEDNAIVFTNWDLLYSLYYVAHVEEGRTGMAFHETFPQDDVRKLVESERAYIDANLGTRPIYTTEYSAEITRYYSLEKVDNGLKLYRITPRP